MKTLYDKILIGDYDLSRIWDKVRVAHSVLFDLTLMKTRIRGEIKYKINREVHKKVTSNISTKEYHENTL
jgi:hypothetical protein